jgi:hypothetical protein
MRGVENERFCVERTKGKAELSEDEPLGLGFLFWLVAWRVMG